MIEGLSNTLAVCGSAGFAGVMFCIGITLGGYWRSLPPDEFLHWFATNNSFVARPLPFTVVPMFVGLAGSAASTDFWWWVGSALCSVGVIVLTVG